MIQFLELFILKCKLFFFGSFDTFLILFLVISPLIVSFILFFIPNYKIYILKQVSLVGSFLIFLLSLSFHFFFNFSELSLNGFQMQFSFNFLLIDSLNLYYSIGIDGLSIWFIILSTFLIPLCILVSWENIKFRLKEFLLLLFFLEFLLIQVFIITDLILFYILFESVLIPMFIMIGVWGSRERKIFASYQFFIYTFFGSVLMLLGIVYLYIEFGTSSYIDLLMWCNFLPENVQIWLFFAFFFSFAVKVPMIPVHVWLPEAHVEAPTAGSVLLAGILLKLGGYGMIRFLVPLFPFGTFYFLPFVYVISLLGVLYTSAVTVRQVDLKKIIAYSSVGHMNFVTLGLFSLTFNGLSGSIFLMLSHGIVSSALFICIGILYDRYKTRVLFYYGGLTTVMPLFSTFFLIFTLANMGLPGLSNFVGEILVLLGVFAGNGVTAFLAAIGTILGGIYSIWLYNRLVFGQFNSNILTTYSDLNKREFFILAMLSFISLFFGIFPNGILNVLYSPIMYNILFIYNDYLLFYY